jgi:predicted nucleic acid-binding protein
VIVVDTNVLVYSLVGGELAAATELLFADDPWWVAPILWRSEFCNVMTVHLRAKRMSLTDAKDAITAAERRMRDREYQVALHAVIDCASESGLTGYDCEFVVLARQLSIPLVTADGRIVRAFPKQARLLSEYAR